MAVKVQVSEEIDRPANVVFGFYADGHVRNHPRWDPDIELWLDYPDTQIGVGTIIRRRNSRMGTPIEGTMEVVEFERDQSFGVLIQDGPQEIRGRTTFESLGPHRTKVTVTADSPEMDESLEGLISERMKRSVGNVKKFIEAET